LGWGDVVYGAKVTLATSMGGGHQVASEHDEAGADELIETLDKGDSSRDERQKYIDALDELNDNYDA
jgi:hypothetical protein